MNSGSCGVPGRGLSRSRSPACNGSSNQRKTRERSFTSTPNTRNCEAQRHSVAEKELLTYFQNTDYGTAYESEPESSDIEEEGSLQELQRSLSELVNRTANQNMSSVSVGEESFICDLPEESLMSSTQNSHNYETQSYSVDTNDLNSCSLESEYITECESELDRTRIEDESTLETLQDSIEDHSAQNCIEGSLDNSTLNKSFACSGNEVTLYKPNAEDVNCCDALPEMDALSSTRKSGSNANRCYNWREFTPMDSIREEEPEMENMEDVPDLEKTAIREYIKSKEKTKYLYDGQNLIRIKPKRNMEMTAIIGKAFWLRRRIRERMMKQIK